MAEPGKSSTKSGSTAPKCDQCRLGINSVIHPLDHPIREYAVNAAKGKEVTHPSTTQGGVWDPTLVEATATCSDPGSAVAATDRPKIQERNRSNNFQTSSSAIVGVSTVTVETSFETVVTQVTLARWQFFIKKYSTLSTTGMAAAASATSTAGSDKLGSMAKNECGGYSRALNGSLGVKILGCVMAFLMKQLVLKSSSTERTLPGHR
ncbi:hypothetical protein BJ875DRAFT_479977 [Amylocarpus encephaloides]|uniref:Uncharacterized protein n=1 Tax=Amylocarpus encephaloides TaxID=45428 RepID=A0A9P7YT40_9HELO|nr:hypothetical protein BJ875DRAFT_479977 [Amylocarpus encephaloides]